MSLNLAINVSGGGSTAGAIIEACHTGVLKDLVTPCVVIASAPGIRALEVAKKHGVPGVVVSFQENKHDRDAYGKKLLDVCEKYNVDYWGQYGLIPLTPANVVSAFEGRSTNQHPASLDPGRLDFGGRGMRGKAAIAAQLFFMQAARPSGAQYIEATAHAVAEKVDLGYLQHMISVPIKADDSLESLHKRMMPFEQQVQIENLALIAQGKNPRIERTEPLIAPGEEEIFKTAKEKALSLYPNG